MINHPDFQEVTEKRNREVKTFPKSGEHWCNRCDASIVGCGTRCDRCGFRDPSWKHRKK